MSKWNELQPLDRWQPQMKSSWALRAFSNMIQNLSDYSLLLPQHVNIRTAI